MSFHFKQFSILHQTEGLKVNTDGCLLGALAAHHQPQYCLDIGTGTGVIALMLAQKFPSAHITAIELNTVACDQARLNISVSPFSEKIEVLNSDILQFHSPHTFDLIVCNPPYFSNHLQGPDRHRNMALHSDHLPQHLLAEKAAQLLSPEGTFFLIYPPKEMDTFETAGREHGLYPWQRFMIENKPGRHHRTIASFGRQQKEPAENRLLLTDKKGQRTSEFSAIMADFYL